ERSDKITVGPVKHWRVQFCPAPVCALHKSRSCLMKSETLLGIRRSTDPGTEALSRARSAHRQCSSALVACYLAFVLFGACAGCALKRSAPVNPCSLAPAQELQAALGEPLSGPTQTDSGQGTSDPSFQLWGVKTYSKCSYIGTKSGLQLSMDILQFADDESAAKFYGNIEGMSARSPATTHPGARGGAKVTQVTGPGHASTYVLKKDKVVTLEVYQAAFKADIAQQASLALLPTIADRLR